MLALIVLRSQDFRGHNRNPRLASPGSTTEVETVHPLLSCPAGTANLPAIPEPYLDNSQPPTQIPPADQDLPSVCRLAPRSARRPATGHRPPTGHWPPAADHVRFLRLLRPACRPRGAWAGSERYNAYLFRYTTPRSLPGGSRRADTNGVIGAYVVKPLTDGWSALRCHEGCEA